MHAHFAAPVEGANSPKHASGKNIFCLELNGDREYIFLHNIREGIGRDFLEIEETTTHLYSGRAPAKQEIED